MTDPLTTQEAAREHKRKERDSQIGALRSVGDVCEMPGWRELRRGWEQSLRSIETGILQASESDGWLQLGRLQGRAAVYRELLQLEHKTWEKLAAIANSSQQPLPLDR